MVHANAEAAQILSVRCSAEQFFRSRGGKFHFAVGHLPADTGFGPGAWLSASGAEKPNLYSDTGRVYFYQKSLILNDQRRAFSEEYVNLLLTICESYVEISARNPLAQLAKITPHELKNTPCILVASASQRETEQEYYRTIIGLQGEFLYAENMEEARLMVIGRKGFLPVEGSAVSPAMRTSIVRLPLVRGEDPILRNYCAFWKKDNSGCYVEEFAELLKAQFSEQKPAAKQNLSNF